MTTWLSHISHHLERIQHLTALSELRILLLKHFDVEGIQGQVPQLIDSIAVHECGIMVRTQDMNRCSVIRPQPPVLSSHPNGESVSVVQLQILSKVQGRSPQPEDTNLHPQNLVVRRLYISFISRDSPTSSERDRSSSNCHGRPNA